MQLDAAGSRSVSEDYAVVSVLTRNSRPCVRPFQRRRPRSPRRTATSVEGLLRGVPVVPTRPGTPSDGSDATRLSLGETSFLRGLQVWRALEPVLVPAHAG